MAEALDPSVVIVLVLLAAAFLVAMGYGVHRTSAMKVFSKGTWGETKFNERNAEQDQYMIDVRMAYRDAMMRENRMQISTPMKHESFASSNPRA